jgi:NADH pyrophosphatase NudC (nudix superfamily)
LIWKPHVTVAALIRDQDRLLMVEETIDGQRVLNQPAGHLEDGESLIDAVIRETLEETGWHMTPTAITGIYRWRNPDNAITFIRVAFLGTADRHDATLELDQEINRVLWLSSSEILQGDWTLRSPMVTECLQDMMNGRRYPLDMLRDLGNL